MWHVSSSFLPFNVHIVLLHFLPSFISKNFFLPFIPHGFLRSCSWILIPCYVSHKRERTREDEGISAGNMAFNNKVRWWKRWFREKVWKKSVKSVSENYYHASKELKKLFILLEFFSLKIPILTSIFSYLFYTTPFLFSLFVYTLLLVWSNLEYHFFPRPSDPGFHPRISTTLAFQFGTSRTPGEGRKVEAITFS